MHHLPRRVFGWGGDTQILYLSDMGSEMLLRWLSVDGYQFEGIPIDEAFIHHLVLTTLTKHDEATGRGRFYCIKYL